MKKSLLALAVFGAFAGVASAQTNVTIYGVVDAGITYEKRGSIPTTTPASTGESSLKLATGVQSGNRLGFKGTEDLGGGLKANFQLENGFDADTGALRQGGRLFGRQAWVGLSGGFGAVALGRQYNPLFVALDSIDPFGTGLAGATTNLMNPSNVRTDNSISYSAPALGGVQLNALYGLGEFAGDNSRGRTFGLSAGYNNGPINVVAAYDNVNGATSATSAINTNKLWLVGATYNFGVATVHAAFESEKNEVGVDNRDIMVGVSAPIGAGNVMASVIDRKDRNSTAVRDTGARQYALGYTYNLSKRTNFYTALARVNNERSSSSFVGDASSGGLVPGAGGSSSAFNVGVRHKF
jgi:predicted porin